MKSRSIEFGDWQTPIPLARCVCQLLKDKGVNPTTIIEPTCGEGSFIFAALEIFDNIKDVYAVEIQKPYVEIVNGKTSEYPDVNFNIINDDIFNIDLRSFKIKGEVLILGNPPWVTNSQLGGLDSQNLPQKSNFKKDRGMSAMTGKGNFDIAEYIVMKLLSQLSSNSGHIAMLVKNSVIKNIVNGQLATKFMLGDLSQYEFNAQKEFGAATMASLLYAKLGGDGNNSCCVYDLYTRKRDRLFGVTYQGQIVYDMDMYNRCVDVDGESQLEWRSGIKHDCSDVMELKRCANGYKNGYNEEIGIESKYVFPLIKSSDIKEREIDYCRKFVIVTQRTTNEDTNSIASNAPLLYKYLTKYSHKLNNRKSRIYKNRYPYSIFGVGDYSFMPYKVIISALYKSTLFSLVSMIDETPVMVDDTCYSIGFENEKFARITLNILNSECVQNFIASLSFKDAKRPINKDLLMRIDILKAAKFIGFNKLGIESSLYDEYIKWLQPRVKLRSKNRSKVMPLPLFQTI